MAKKTKVPKKVYLWKDRKRNFLGLPWTFTIYRLDQDRLYINTGIFNTTEDEVRLYRITDVTLKRSFWQRIIRTGTIHCDSADATMNNFDIKNVRHAKEVKDMLSKLVDESRLRNRVYTSENVTPGPHEHDREGEPLPPPEVDMTDVNGNHIPDVYER